MAKILRHFLKDAVDGYVVQSLGYPWVHDIFLSYYLFHCGISCRLPMLFIKLFFNFKALPKILGFQKLNYLRIAKDSFTFFVAIMHGSIRKKRLHTRVRDIFRMPIPDFTNLSKDLSNLIANSFSKYYKNTKMENEYLLSITSPRYRGLLAAN